MKNKILEHIDNPALLEELYQDDKKSFEKAFSEIYPEIATNKIADFWKARLEYKLQKPLTSDTRKVDVVFLVISAFIAAVLIKIPAIFSFNPDTLKFFEKNTALIVFFGLSTYILLIKKNFNIKHIIPSLLVFVVSALYINLLPTDRNSQTLNLTYIHLPLFLWCYYGLVFIGFDFSDKTKRIEYIRYNGDVAILGAIILIAGGILTGITLGLFAAIDFQIEDFYFNYIVIPGLVSVAIVATYITRNFAFVTNKIAPIIANIFSPVVLITLLIYLVSILISGKDPYNDRDFLLVFNLMLLGVMGITVFSVSESSENKKQRFNAWILFALCIVTLVVDVIALSAILYRLGEYGFTPNRTAVLGSNLLIFGNLVLFMIDLYKVSFKKAPINKVEMTIASYLPIYTFWTIVVVFGFPLIFGLG